MDNESIVVSLGFTFSLDRLKTTKFGIIKVSQYIKNNYDFIYHTLN